MRFFSIRFVNKNIISFFFVSSSNLLIFLFFFFFFSLSTLFLNSKSLNSKYYKMIFLLFSFARLIYGFLSFLLSLYFIHQIYIYDLCRIYKRPLCILYIQIYISIFKVRLINLIDKYI